ncbi:DUF2975 domain-containing protein [Streptomyces sp. BR123]|uniref:DUF2975 domain-containing protein n=1 Tax=Streptomyces sp. BR123 TaxID=2749828 RepID=UPI0015C4E56E|nr:DUF2975 domain-containing protein [Streptomyces sp. BR123]NXY99807.1 DUF2975 domain-containing protein [Streptomyces sp. BR123]
MAAPVSEDKKLLEPLSTVVSTTLRLLAGLLLAGFALSALNGSIPLWGGPDATDAGVCATADWISTNSVGPADTALGARDGARLDAVARYCAQDPSAGQRTLRILAEVPSFVLLLGGLALLDRLLRSAARDGVHARRTTAGLRALALWVLVGGVAACLVEAAARTALLSTLTTHVAFSAGDVLHTLTPPYLLLLTGLGLLVFARIVRAGTAMREDLEGVI